MEGYIDEYGQAKVNLTVSKLPIDAVIDTGFDGDLCLPIQIAIRLGLKIRNIMTVELADGTRKRELVFSGLVRFGAETREINIVLTESEDALIGTNMFSKLEIDFIAAKVVIE